jgi:predicted metalloenzyme YecM
MNTVQDFYDGSKKYVALFNQFIQKHHFTGITQADHICYKCGSAQSFEKIRALFESESAYIYQSIISKRRIAVIRFAQGIETTLGVINFLELSDQKPDGSQHEGFDHIEVYPTGISYEEMVKRLAATERVILEERPHHTTHDVDMGEGFKFRCTRGLLVEKIKATEMV